MKLHLTSAEHINLVHACTAEGVVIRERRYTHSLLLTPQQIVSMWRPATLTDLAEHDFDAILELAPEVVLLGTGTRLQFPPARITAPLLERSMGLEVMDTAAACRTYNILAAEGRKVLAALLLNTATADT